jgi:hypothetical protein
MPAAPQPPQSPSVIVTLTRRDQLRRVILLCCHFARNLAYHRAGLDNKGQVRRRGSDFWVTVNGNFLDECAVEWSKLFGITASDRKGVHYWGNAVSDRTRFEREMFQQIDRAKFDAMFKAVRTYRNKFFAHLDQELKINLPTLEIAKESVWFYHQYIVKKEAQPEDLSAPPSDLPTDVEDYYRFCGGEAKKIYGA